MAKVRLTTAQALVRFLAAQRNADSQPIFAGVWAIFGHGNVAGLGEALQAIGDALPIAARTSNPWRSPPSPTPKPPAATA